MIDGAVELNNKDKIPRKLSLEEELEFATEIERAGSNDPEIEFDSPKLNVDEELDIDKMRGIAVRVDELIENADFAETALPAIIFCLFNYLRLNPQATEAELKRELSKLQRLSDEEKTCSDIRNPLPTVGIEIEVPVWKLTQDKVAALDLLEIPNYAEAHYDLWEVNPNYSYSAAVQSRILQELVKLGAIPIDSQTQKVQKDQLLSLHVNFGMPTGVTSEELTNYRPQMALLNDLIVYAFSSIQRVMGRKTNTSHSWDHLAALSEKSQRVRDPNRLSNHVVRLELRTGEFRDYPTFRMLSETQQLVAMFVAYVKTREKIPASFVEACLADLWVDFEKEVSDYFKSEELEPNAVDNERKKVEVVSHFIFTDLKEKSRSIITNYARKIAKLTA